MLQRLKWFAQAIAQPSAIQIALFPEFVEVANELMEALKTLPERETMRGLANHVLEQMFWPKSPHPFVATYTVRHC